jgi:hypothetical protein
MTLNIPYSTVVNLQPATPVSAESHQIGIVGTATYASGYIQLVQVPESTMPSSVSIPGYNEITSGSPTGMQFLVDYTTGVIQFATAQNGNTISVSYNGLGTQFAAQNINELQNPLSTVATQTLTYMSPFTSATVTYALAPNIVKPNNISNTNTDNFTFPNEVTVSSLTSTGVVHNNVSGLLSTSLIVNADVSASAAIAYSKLNLTGDIQSSDIASGQVVKSLNSLTDAITLAAGNNITLTPSGNTITIAASGTTTGFQILVSDPGSPTTGECWFNSTDAQFKAYNGSSIVILG